MNMSRVAALGCVAVMLFAPNLSAQVEKLPPSMEEVRAAVHDVVAEDPDRVEAARVRLQGWGEAAVPHLEKLARDGVSFGEQHKLLVAIATVATSSAVDLYVAILAGETRIPRTSALTVPGWKLQAALKNSDQARAAVLAILREEREWLTLSQAAHLCGDLGIKDAEPDLSGLLEHENLSVRGKAAGALGKLTGRVVAMRRPALSFPTERRIAGLFASPVLVQRPADWNGPFASFTSCLAGRPVLVVGAGRSAWMLSSDLQPERAVRFDLDRYVLGITVLPPTSTDPAVVVALASHSMHGGPTHVVGYGPDLVPLWEHVPVAQRIEDLAVVSGENSEPTLAVGIGGEAGIVLLDRTGKQIGQFQESHVLYGLHARPDRPLEVLESGWGARVWQQHAGAWQARDLSDGPPDQYFYIRHALLLGPNGPGAGIVVAGTGSLGVGQVALAGEDANHAWVATLAGGPHGLALLEPATGPVLVTVTDAGEFLAFTPDGVLLYSDELPEPRGVSRTQAVPRVAIYAIEGGQHAAGRWGVTVRLLDGVYFYALDATRLLEVR